MSGIGSPCKHCGARLEQAHSVNCATELDKLQNLNNSLPALREFWDAGWNAEEAIKFPTREMGVAYYMGRDCRKLVMESEPPVAAATSVQSALHA
jgi:hypothetical protein